MNVFHWLWFFRAKVKGGKNSVFPLLLVWSTNDFLSESVSNISPGSQTLTMHFEVCLPPACKQQRKACPSELFSPSALC